MKQTIKKSVEILNEENNKENQKLVRFKEEKKKEYKNGTSVVQYCKLFNVDGKKVFEYKNMSVDIPEKDDMLDFTAIICYPDFFVAQHKYSSMTKNSNNTSFKVYTYSGLTVLCSSEAFNSTDTANIKKIARRAKEVEDMFGKSIFKDDETANS